MRNVLITGVSTGIGFHTAKYLLERDFRVFGSVRKESDLERVKAALGPHFTPLLFDVRDSEAIARAREQVAAEVGEAGLDVLINNAGIVVHGPLKDLPESEFQKQFDVNVVGVMRVTRAFLPLLGARLPARERPGRILNISSVSALITNPFLVPYCASKRALEAFSEGLRRELLLYGIPVVSILPGAIATPIWDKAEQKDDVFQGSDYEVLMAKIQRFMNAARRKALEPEVLAALIFKIINQKNPRRRYILTNNKWPLLIGRLLPTALLDALFRRMFEKSLGADLPLRTHPHPKTGGARVKKV